MKNIVLSPARTYLSIKVFFKKILYSCNVLENSRHNTGNNISPSELKDNSVVTQKQITGVMRKILDHIYCENFIIEP